MEGLAGCYLGSCSLSQLFSFCPTELTPHVSPLKVVGALCLYPFQRDAVLLKAQGRRYALTLPLNKVISIEICMK